MAKTFLTIETELAQMWAGKAFSSLTAGEQTQLKLRINLAKDYIVNWPKPSGGWTFLEEPGYITLKAAHTTGTIGVVQYSTAVTIGSGAVSPVFVAGMADYALLVVDSGTESYRIKTFTNVDNIVLYEPYLRTTDADTTYSIVYDRYVLDSMFNGIVKGTVKLNGEGGPMSYISNPQFIRQFPKSTAIGTPDYYGLDHVVKSGTDIGKRIIWFRESYPEVAGSVHHSYYQTVDDMTADGDISIIGYQSGGDNAILLASLWQMKEVGEEYGLQERQVAQSEADKAIGQLWANDLLSTEDKQKESSSPDSRISDLSNW